MAHHVQSKDDLTAKLAEAGENLVVIDFSAAWCGPCRAIAPVFEALATEFSSVVFLKVDIDECDDISEEYGIRSMPTFVFLKNGIKVKEFSGASEERLKETIVELK